MTVPRGADLLLQGVRALTEAGIPDASTDARRLLAHVAKVPAGRLTLMLPEPVASGVPEAYAGVIARRLAREPVAQIVGRRMFYGREFFVTPDVLDPRPDTETLVEVALAEPFERVLDLGTGTGCIVLTLVAEARDRDLGGVWGVGVDVSPQALEVAFWNRNAMGLEGPVALREGHWFDPLRTAFPGRFDGFDLIVSNPPYIAADEMAGLSPEVRDHEPRIALTDDADGLTAYREIAAGVRPWLAQDGRVIVEIGPTQGAVVAALFTAAGLVDVRVLPDLDGRDRVVLGRSPR